MAYEEMGSKEPTPYKHDAEADNLERNSVAMGHMKALDTVSNRGCAQDATQYDPQCVCGAV